MYYKEEEVCTVTKALAELGVNIEHDNSGRMVTKKHSRFLCNPDGTLWVYCGGKALVSWQVVMKLEKPLYGEFQYMATNSNMYVVVNDDKLSVSFSA